MYSGPDLLSNVDRLAFLLSEIHNNEAPIGWETYRPLAFSLLQKFPIKDIVADARFFDYDFPPRLLKDK